MGLPLRSPVAKLSCEAATEENAKRRSFMPRTQVTGKANFSGLIRTVEAVYLPASRALVQSFSKPCGDVGDAVAKMCPIREATLWFSACRFRHPCGCCIFPLVVGQL